MQIQLDAASMTATVEQFDPTLWAVGAKSVPDTYLVVICQPLDPKIIQNSIKNRVVANQPQTRYVTTMVDNTRTVQPEVFWRQVLLPVGKQTI